MGAAFDLEEMTDDLDKICHEYSRHEECIGSKCLIGYARQTVDYCREKEKDRVRDAYDKIPMYDLRGGYDEYDILHALAHIVNQCHSCRKDHSDECILNIVRSCYEVIELGEEQKYEGSPLEYLMKIKGLDAQKAAIVAEEYARHKEERLKKKK